MCGSDNSPSAGVQPPVSRGTPLVTATQLQTKLCFASVCSPLVALLAFSVRKLHHVSSLSKSLTLRAVMDRLAPPPPSYASHSPKHNHLHDDGIFEGYPQLISSGRARDSTPRCSTCLASNALLASSLGYFPTLCSPPTSSSEHGAEDAIRLGSDKN